MKGMLGVQTIAHMRMLVYSGLVRPFSGLQVRPAVHGHAKHDCPPLQGK